jgi:hypothetical protein
MLLAGAWVSPALAAVEVNIDRNPVQVNESFQLVFSLDQSPDREPDFSSLQQHFMILNNSRSSSISIINGEYRRSVRYTLQLMAKQIGEFMIPSIRFDQERSEPFQVTVKPSSMASVPHDQLVLELLADQPEIYVQGQVILTLRLLSAVNISDYQFGKIVVENLDTVVEPLGDARRYQTRIADKSYLVLEQRYALFPQQSGRLEVSPVMAEVRLPSHSNFDPFRTGGEIRRLRSQPLYIDIEPIPPDFSQPYWLPAKKIELREDWQGDLAGLVAGEPITRSLSVIADGLTAAQLPELVLSPIDGVKQYPDQPGLENSRSSDGIRGKREQRVALIPGAEGRYRVPEINLPWWNLETGQVEIATIPERELVVGPATVAPATASGPEPVPETVPGPAPAVIEPNPFWLWLSLLLACGWGASAVYWWFASRRRARVEPRPQTHPSLRQARRELQRACDAGDAAGARQALLAWGQALLAPRAVHNLRQLCAEFGAEFTQQVEILNTSLYARAREPWQGAELLRLCRQLEPGHGDDGPAQTGLLPLNPAG